MFGGNALCCMKQISFSEVCCYLFSRGSMGREKSDKPLPAGTARPNTFLRGSSKDLLDNQTQEEQRREMLETVKQLTGGVDAERASTEADRSRARELGEGRPLGPETGLLLALNPEAKYRGRRGGPAVKNIGSMLRRLVSSSHTLF